MLTEVGRIVNSTLTTGEVFEHFADEIRKLLLFDRITIVTHDLKKETGTIAFVSGMDVPNQRIGDVFPLSGSDSMEDEIGQ